MSLPKSYKGILKLLVAIAEHGNDYSGKGISGRDYLNVGSCIADIQNWCGENQELLEKFNIKYKSF